MRCTGLYWDTVIPEGAVGVSCRDKGTAAGGSGVKLGAW